MKAWNIIWTIMAIAALIAVLSGAYHQLVTLGISLAMCTGFRAELKNAKNHGRE